jgi:lysophospholipase
MPIIVALERPSGQLAIWPNSTIFEFTPWEMGSYDTGGAGFAPLQYVGSNFSNGSLPVKQHCVSGFDNIGFVMGTSSSLFNAAFLEIQGETGVPDSFIRTINATLAQIGLGNKDIASWPNPFLNWKPAINLNANSTILTLVDGGEDLQNIPLHPLTLRLRKVDVILAIDSSADTPTRWPNGTSLVATYQRFLNGYSTNNSALPLIPDQNTFINLGLNSHPTFFGCDVNSSAETTPLIVYLPNAPYSTNSNFSTFQLKYTNDERNSIIQNGYNVVTMGNATVDPRWPACLGCAILSRSLSRTRTQPPSICIDCFDKYCWNGTLNSTTPPPYAPGQIISQTSSGCRNVWITELIYALLVLYVMLM